MASKDLLVTLGRAAVEVEAIAQECCQTMSVPSLLMAFAAALPRVASRSLLAMMIWACYILCSSYYLSHTTEIILYFK